MPKKRSLTVVGALLTAAMLVLVAVPADATKYRKADRSEKKEFKHWLRAQNHDWRRWMYEQKYHWWKWVHDQKRLFYKGEWDSSATFEFPGSGSGSGDTGGNHDDGKTGGGDPPADVPKPRFEMLVEYNNLAVRDNRTGLVWEKNPNTGVVNFYAAWLTCARKNLNGQMGWRIPATADLTSLMDGMNPDQANDVLLPDGHPFSGIIATAGKGYWSATQSKNLMGVTVNPLAVYFGLSASGGNMANTVGQLPYTNLAGVWCVHGAPIGPSVTD